MDNRKNMVIGTLDTEVEKQKLGIKVTKEKMVSCSECGIDLIHIMIVKETIGINQKIYAICDKCKSKSFAFTVENGECYVGAAENHSIIDINTDTKEKDGSKLITQIFKVI